jgi:DNA-directed RNA polymerase subunit F
VRDLPLIGKEILNSREVPISYVKELLRARQLEGDLRYEQRLVLAYVQEFSKLEYKEAKLLENALIKLNIARLKHSHIIKIIDLLPKTKVELDLILLKDKVILKDEDKELIINEVKRVVEGV